ncbi:hypothetical protein DFR29_10386 [Tahibacter aquaticus]|uniref:Uncharacterized protein n=1 Tax=Tahibacter aquaticus TaxID=520092 RepID=A0A4R6Z4L3_9GAMM|nr:hypothetical protein [Tahibacter aquaticus]TDR46554.1 hypothetical protein DFR29_10386 [Tahibacter aquaticus]
MLSVLRPETLSFISQFPGGLIPLPSPGEPDSVLVVKVPKEYILAAVLKRGFKVYVLPIHVADTDTAFLVSAFFDDEEEPLAIRTPLLRGWLTSLLLMRLLTDEINVHFFDEHDREHAAFKARLNVPVATRQLLLHSELLPETNFNARAVLDEAGRIFGLRDTASEAAAIDVEFGESLMPEDLFMADMRPDLHAFHGSKGWSEWALVREEPGPAHEVDIAQLLQRIFPANTIYINPKRPNNDREIADVLVITSQVVLILQAKDSPNTAKGLMAPLDKKRRKVMSAVSDAARQVKRAAQYIRSSPTLVMKVGGATVQIELNGRPIAGLVVVKELFLDSYDEYTSILLSLSSTINGPCIVLDYPELNAYTKYLRDENSFREAFMRVFDAGRETGRFLRLRFGLSDPEGSSDQTNGLNVRVGQPFFARKVPGI